MTSLSDSKRKVGIIKRAGLRTDSYVGLTILICAHIVVCCVSLVRVADHQSYILYDEGRLFYAVAVVVAVSFLALLFVMTRFSFGYFAGFYLYTMILGFLWLSSFSKFHYDYKLAALSAAASILLFLLPALLINGPISQAFTLSMVGFECLLRLLLLLALATIAIASMYNFKLSSLGHIYEFRDDIQFPAIIRYPVGIVPNAVLPFVFASYVTLNARWKATFTLLLFPLFYPVTLSKLAFFLPVWMLAFLLLTQFLGVRTTVIVSLFGPILLGLALMLNSGGDRSLAYFNLINIRMMATPSSAMDIYSEFFSGHPLTYFCQISILKSFIACPYQEQLAVVMQKAYGFGNLNASLFATEGIASVGLYLAPLSALVGGFVIALGNRLSAGLPPRFILLSGAIMPQILLNVPLTTTLLTYGAGALFLLWYITPREISAREA